MKSNAIVAVFLLSTVICSVFAINCYQCNSHIDPECEDLHKHPPHNVSHFYKPCEGDYHGREPFCRTITYQIKDPEETRNTRRIVRTCGYLPERTNCYSADNAFHLETVCQCFEDGCNNSGTYSFVSIAAILIALAGAFLF